MAIDGHNTKQLSHQNDAWLSHRTLATVDEVSAKSADGTRVSGYLVTPANLVAGKRYPTILRIGQAYKAGRIAPPDHDRNFEFGLQRVLDGIAVFIAGRRESGRV